jgi:hypothetical protein
MAQELVNVVDGLHSATTGLDALDGLICGYNDKDVRNLHYLIKPLIDNLQQQTQELSKLNETGGWLSNEELVMNTTVVRMQMQLREAKALAYDAVCGSRDSTGDDLADILLNSLTKKIKTQYFPGIQNDHAEPASQLQAAE